MTKNIYALLLAAGGLLYGNASVAGEKIKFYFNRPVDNSVSTTANATYLNNCVADTLVAYINRAQYTIDIAQYDYNQGSYANIANAINNAYSRGVQVRWIYDGSSSNTGLSLLNAGINTLGSPTSSSYGIMHHKYVIFDANSANADEAIVWTGSFDWSTSQFNTDVNNAVVIQDSALAHAYTAEFNMMWGGTGATPNASASKFGPHKTDLGRHSFTIEGKQVELYISPSDGTNSHIQSTISSASADLYFGMYTFTDNSDASLIISRYNSGVYVAGIDDSYSNSYSPYNLFSSTLGANFKVYSTPGMFHSKYLIVDQADACSDPMVLTGSHNWTISADTKNDENTLIIHDDTAANIYYQSFHAMFATLGGSLTAVTGCTTGVPAAQRILQGPRVFPNPANGAVTFSYELAARQNVTIVIYNITGQEAERVTGDQLQEQGNHTVTITAAHPGIYFAKFIFNTDIFTERFVITGDK